MQAEEIIAAIQSHLNDAQVEVKIEGSHVHLRVVSTAFSGQRPVKKQQMVYAALAQAIGSGAIHAVHMQTLTPEEALKV